MFLPIPDRMLPHFEAVTPALLQELGVRCLLSDIDNTLVTYEDERPTSAVLRWLSDMRENGITVIFLSNNDAKRVSLFAEGLELSFFAKAGKPLAKRARQALRQAGFSPTETAVLGDQLFTDVWVGKAIGAAATLAVPPIRDKRTLFVRFKRLLERPLISAFRRREAKRLQKNAGKST